MKLQTKIRLTVFLTWLLVIAVVIAQSSLISLRNYSNLEQQQNDVHYQRMLEALQRQQEALDSFTGDWAHWTSTYDYIQRKYHQYVNETMGTITTFKEVGLNYILYFDNQGQFYDGRAFSFQSNDFYPVSPALLSRIDDHPALLRHDVIDYHSAGFIAGEQAPIMLSSYPITNTEMTKAPNGNIIMGFDYTRQRIDELGKTVRADIRFINTPDAINDAALRPLLTRLEQQGSPYLTDPVTNRMLYLYAPLKDIDGHLLGLFRMDLPRTTYMLGLRSIYKSVALVVFSGIILFFLFEYLIKKIVLDRLLSFKTALQDIRNSRDFSRRIPVSSEDEITDLVENSNQMLDVISMSQEQLLRLLFSFADINRELLAEIKNRQNVEAELANLNSQMIIASRRAGMAEVASSVLHNVGNTLNSVNVSATLLYETLEQSEMNTLASLATLLDNHKDNLSDYLLYHPKGKQIPDFITLLAKKWQLNKNLWLTETAELIKNIDLIKEVIASQQTLSTMVSVLEFCTASELIDDALFFCKQEIISNDITVKKDYITLPPIFTDRIKVLQILVNLVKNAIESLAASTLKERVLMVRVRPQDKDRLAIEVIDNGLGIDERDRDKLFTFGFTTKKHGHGIGLHGSCNSAQELGGTLDISSEGINMGATVILVLPYKSGDASGRKPTDTPAVD